MKSCCLKCRKDTENVNPRVPGTSNNKTMILWKYATCGSKKSRFMKNQEGKALLSNLALRTPLHKVQILGSILFWGATSFNSNDFFFNQKNFTLFLIGGLFIYLFIFVFSNGLFTMLFRRCPTLLKSTLKNTTLFRGYLTLF